MGETSEEYAYPPPPEPPGRPSTRGAGGGPGRDVGTAASEMAAITGAKPGLRFWNGAKPLAVTDKVRDRQLKSRMIVALWVSIWRYGQLVG